MSHTIFSVTKRPVVYQLVIPSSELVRHFLSNLVLVFWDQFLMVFRYATVKIRHLTFDLIMTSHTYGQNVANDEWANI